MPRPSHGSSTVEPGRADEQLQPRARSDEEAAADLLSGILEVRTLPHVAERRPGLLLGIEVPAGDAEVVEHEIHAGLYERAVERSKAAERRSGP